MTFPAAVGHLYDAAFSHIAVDVTVTPPAGGPVETRAVIRHNQEIEREGIHGAELATTAKLPVEDVGTPVRDTAITDGTGTWYVDNIVRNNGHMVEVVVREG